ncbi:reactivating factor for ethanolamine ammonia lyase [Halobellus sp. Atlit-31R]|nr:reactivating factor for ethanolamine ammonia lyase [Halobellus sp. Atlit-31R]
MSRGSPEVVHSIGIDIGTTTTQIVVSDLTLRVPSYDGAAKVEIVDRELVYRSQIHETPYDRGTRIRTAAVIELIDDTIEQAGFQPNEIDTGAVIATGEAARTKNAEPLLDRLAARSGQFVVAAAGASLEAILAGRGAGAGARSERQKSTVVSVDIGGGTTNIAVFEGGTVRQTRCIDIGGRDVRFDADGAITSVADSVGSYVESSGPSLVVGEKRPTAAYRSLANWMAARVFDSVDGPPFDEETEALAIGTLPTTGVDVDEVIFTGGVGRLVGIDAERGANVSDPFEFDDFGVFLSTAIRNHDRFQTLPIHRSGTDIRATVLGVGTQSMSFSGRTIAPDNDLLPTRNLPVVSVSGLDAGDTASDIEQRTAAAIRGARDDRGRFDEFSLYAPSIGELTYERVGLVAEGMAAAYDGLFDERVPFILLTKQNCAKVFGQTFETVAGSRPAMVLDEIEITGERYIDLGTPIAEGTAVPATVKTLIFDE